MKAENESGMHQIVNENPTMKANHIEFLTKMRMKVRNDVDEGISDIDSTIHVKKDIRLQYIKQEIEREKAKLMEIQPVQEITIVKKTKQDAAGHYVVREKTGGLKYDSSVTRFISQAGSKKQRSIPPPLQSTTTNPFKPAPSAPSKTLKSSPKPIKSSLKVLPSNSPSQKRQQVFF